MINNFIAFAATLPLLLPLTMITLCGLTGRISAGGLWRDSFNSGKLSPVRVYQTMAMLGAAGCVLIGLAQNNFTAFAPVPDWLFAAAGGGNAAYIGSKYVALKKSQASNQRGD